MRISFRRDPRPETRDSGRVSDWQRVFLLSTLRTPNHQDLLPNYGWNFPRETWLQNRLEKIRKEQSHETDR
jgi:hypothetical protein